jgi:hypothetical protein
MGSARMLLLVATGLGASLGLQADPILLDSGTLNGTASRSAGSGFATGISVTTTTNLTQIALNLGMPGGGNIKYMIWDGTNTNLLFSQTVAVGASATTSYVLSNPFSFSLTAGSTYYIGAIADGSLNYGYIFPATTVTQNGLTSLSSGSTNYLNFASPTFNPGTVAITLPIQLFGTQGTGGGGGGGGGQTPEPATLLPVAFGVVALVTKKFRSARRS